MNDLYQLLLSVKWDIRGLPFVRRFTTHAELFKAMLDLNKQAGAAPEWHIVSPSFAQQGYVAVNIPLPDKNEDIIGRIGFTPCLDPDVPWRDVDTVTITKDTVVTTRADKETTVRLAEINEIHIMLRDSNPRLSIDAMALGQLALEKQ